MRLLVCGGRHFNDVPRLWSILDGIDDRHEKAGNDGGVRLVIDGGQMNIMPDGSTVGADYWAHQWALARNKPTMRFLADWQQYGRSAGPKRNIRMFTESMPTHGLVMPGGRGTAHMLSIMKGKIPVMEIVT